MRTSIASLVALCAACTLACGPSAPPPAPPPPAPPPPYDVGAEMERCVSAAGIGSTQACQCLQGVAKAAVQDKGKACTQDQDCACYRPLAGTDSCGGVTDKQTSIELRLLANKLLGCGLAPGQQCAPWICRPRCQAGYCQR